MKIRVDESKAMKIRVDESKASHTYFLRGVSTKLNQYGLLYFSPNVPCDKPPVSLVFLIKYYSYFSDLSLSAISTENQRFSFNICHLWWNRLFPGNAGS